MGTQNDAMAGGNSTVWSLYNGTTWTAAASLSTNSDYGRGGSGGGSAAGFITGDYHPATTGNTYNWYGGFAVTASIAKFNTKLSLKRVFLMNFGYFLERKLWIQ